MSRGLKSDLVKMRKNSDTPLLTFPHSTYDIQLLALLDEIAPI